MINMIVDDQNVTYLLNHSYSWVGSRNFEEFSDRLIAS